MSVHIRSKLREEIIQSLRDDPNINADVFDHHLFARNVVRPWVNVRVRSEHVDSDGAESSLSRVLHRVLNIEIDINAKIGYNITVSNIDELAGHIEKLLLANELNFYSTHGIDYTGMTLDYDQNLENSSITMTLRFSFLLCSDRLEPFVL